MKPASLFTTLLALMLAVPSANAFAAQRQIASGNGLQATVSDRIDWCQETVDVSIKAPSQDFFSGDRIVVQRLLGQVRLSLEEECPQATAIRVAGVVEPSGTVFIGSATKASGWVLSTGSPTTTVAATPKEPTRPSPEIVPLSRSADATSSSTQNPSSPRTLTPIQSCDRLAAHPNDPEAFANGVPEEQLQTTEVISACEAATKQDKKSPRLAFQLARGYLKAGRVEDAIEQLLSSAKQGHGGALAYLADIHLDGGPGIEPDPAIAHALYIKSAAAGFEPAKAILAQFEDYTDKSAAADMEEKNILAQQNNAPVQASGGMGYVNPDIIENLLRGNLDDVSNNEQWVKNYLVEVADSISQECKRHFTAADIKYLRQTAAIKSVDSTASGGIANIYNGLEVLAQQMSVLQRGGSMGDIYQDAARAERDYEKNTMKMLEEAIKDSFVLMMSHPCGSQKLASFSKSLTDYIENVGAPRMSADQLLQACQRTENKNRTQQGNQFCICIARKLASNPIMTRADRKGLSSDFQASAQKIIHKNKDYFRSCF